jgi:hypothetical protein
MKSSTEIVGQHRAPQQRFALLSKSPNLYWYSSFRSNSTTYHTLVAVCISTFPSRDLAKTCGTCHVEARYGVQPPQFDKSSAWQPTRKRIIKSVILNADWVLITAWPKTAFFYQYSVLRSGTSTRIFVP